MPATTAKDCNLMAALGVVGDYWTLGVLRCVFLGMTRFSAIEADIGIASNVLSDRLANLVDADVLERRAYQDRPPRHEYVPTPRGAELEPILRALTAWGSRLP